MELYFLRHGLAGQYGDPRYKDDSLRPLTDEGRKKMQRISLGMKVLGLKFDAILSSPYLRAKQTAAIVAKAYKIKKVRLTDNLQPPSSVEKLLKEIGARLPQARHVLAAGHEPDLTQMVSALLKSRRHLNIEFKKGGLCCLTIEAGADAVFNWLLTPSQLELLAKAKR